MPTEYDDVIREIAEVEDAIRDWTADMEMRLLSLRRRLQVMDAERG